MAEDRRRGQQRAHRRSDDSMSNLRAEASSRIERVIGWLERRRDARSDKFEEGALRGQKLRSWMEKLVLRAATGLVYVAAIIISLYFGIYTTAALVAALSWLCCSEFFRMAREGGGLPNEIIGLAAAIAYPLAPLLPISNPLLLVTALMLVSCGFWYVLTPRVSIGDVALTAFGPLYTSLSYASVVLIRGVAPGWTGFFLTLGVMGSVWANDTCAYLVGSRFGRHKLAPTISPNKSVEGFWGGIAASVAVWLVLGLNHVAGVGLRLALVTGIAVSFCAVAGDLFESRIKRGVGVKDSGNILPGHGGLLDRSDSMLFGALVAYALLHLGGVL